MLRGMKERTLTVGRVMFFFDNVQNQKCTGFQPDEISKLVYDVV